MGNDEKYYWIKLKKQMFEDNEAIDFLLSQNNGSDYAMIYILLCLKTMNTQGELASHIGEMIIPYTPEKIQRDLKYFSIDSIIVALDLYKQLGLVYESQNGSLVISNYDEMIGSETKAAKRMRDMRERRKQDELESKEHDSVTLLQDSYGNCYTNVTQDIRDKSIENRDKIKDIRDTEKDIDEDILHPSAENPPTEDPSTKDTIDYKFYQDSWNEICTTLPKCTMISDKRKKAIKACVVKFGKESVIDAMKKVDESDFLSGRNGRWLGCSFDWLFNTNNMLKAIEDTYKNSCGGKKIDSSEWDVKFN